MQNPDEKAKEQLEKNKANFEDWFGRDVGNGWHYLSAIFCMELHPGIKSHCSYCSICDDFIIHREDELTEKLANIESSLPERENITKFDKEDFKTLIKYMLFSMPKKALPIGGNFTKAVRKAINEASDLDNIKVCAFPTKEQRLILSWKKAIVIAPWGCGKTWLMADKAIEFARKGEKVVFGFFKDRNFRGEPLILLDMELKFEEFPNVNVVLIPFSIYKENKLKDYTKDANIFFGDEFSDMFFPYDDIVKNETNSFLNSLDFCWLTVSNNIYERYGALRGDFKNLREYTESWKPKDYHIIEMKTPIRSTRAIAKYIKENVTDE